MGPLVSSLLMHPPQSGIARPKFSRASVVFDAGVRRFMLEPARHDSVVAMRAQYDDGDSQEHPANPGFDDDWQVGVLAHHLPLMVGKYTHPANAVVHFVPSGAFSFK